MIDMNGTHIVACPRTPVAKLPAWLIPIKYFERLEHDQKLSSCCRHPENHDIEARYSSAKVRDEEKAPNVYIFYCTCGKVHRRLCAGGGDVRPMWDVC